MRSSPNVLTLFLVLATVGSMGSMGSPLEFGNEAAHAAIAKSVEMSSPHTEASPHMAPMKDLGTDTKSDPEPIPTTETPTTPVTPAPTPKPTTPTPKPTTPTPEPTTTKPTTTTPTTEKPTTPSTTPSTTPTPAPTTTTVAPSTSSVSPANITTSAPHDITTTPSPHSKNSFNGPSFVGGIALSLGLMCIGLLGWKYYKARTERNYRTL